MIDDVIPEPWLGHRDLCCCQWSDWCDCDPDNPIDLTLIFTEVGTP